MDTPIPHPFGPDEAIAKAWIIVRDPGCVPEAKTPPVQTREGVDAMLRELVAVRPGADLTVAQVTPQGALWVEDGRERLTIAASLDGVPTMQTTDPSDDA